MRVAHISDPHLLSLAGSRLLDFANKRWIGGVNLLVRRGRHHHAELFEAMVDDINALSVDHVLCTGDVTNLSLESEFRFARRHFDRFALDPDNVTVIPGNHDTYVRGGEAHFGRHFAAFCRSDDPWRREDAPWPIVRVRGPLSIIGVSTGLETPWFTAYGRIGSAQLARLREILGHPELRGTLRLVAIHHPPVGGNSKSSVRGLHDRGEFAEVLAECGAEFVLHGHDHRDLAGELPAPGGEPVPVRGIPSATFEDDKRPALRASYRIYEVAGGAPSPAGEELRVWDPGERRFFARSAPTRGRV